MLSKLAITLAALSPLALQCACLTTLDLDGDYNASLDTQNPTDDDGTPPDMDVIVEPDASLDIAPDTSPSPDLPPDMPDAQDMPPDMRPDMPPAYEPGEGLFFSEIIEGSVGSNKFIELYNARNTPLDLEHIWLANFNASGNPDISSAVTFHIGSKIAMIPPKQVVVLCHSMQDQVMDTSICDFQTTTTLNFNGDDPLAIYFDRDKNGMLDTNDTLLDSFGQLDNSKPDTLIWADTSYRRCNLTPYLSQSLFDPAAYYIVTKPETYTDLGSPPEEPISCR